MIIPFDWNIYWNRSSDSPRRCSVNGYGHGLSAQDRALATNLHIEDMRLLKACALLVIRLHSRKVCK